jgi:proteasome lid subunit RPN8/RPN11
MKRTAPKKSEWSVYRTRPLPVGDLRGSFILAESIIPATRDALVSFALAGIHEGGHEGMAFWAGLENRELHSTVILEVIVPDAEHSSGRVMASAEAVGRAARAARSHGLGILCQAHSHPGCDTRHSDGDDRLILLPFEGMLSIVVPEFGIHFAHLNEASVHQFQDGIWVLCSAASVAANIVIAPARMDLRA